MRRVLILAIVGSVAVATSAGAFFLGAEHLTEPLLVLVPGGLGLTGSAVAFALHRLLTPWSRVAVAAGTTLALLVAAPWVFFGMMVLSSNGWHVVVAPVCVALVVCALLDRGGPPSARPALAGFVIVHLVVTVAITVALSYDLLRDTLFVACRDGDQTRTDCEQLGWTGAAAVASAVALAVAGAYAALRMVSAGPLGVSSVREAG